ncbi:hypothetical protein H4W33_006386 [Kibdelosporangium phytohabitans]|nr:hypothetical protein [Kibdelosporangium phytohabitans]
MGGGGRACEWMIVGRTSRCGWCAHEGVSCSTRGVVDPPTRARRRPSRERSLTHVPGPIRPDRIPRPVHAPSFRSCGLPHVNQSATSRASEGTVSPWPARTHAVASTSPHRNGTADELHSIAHHPDHLDRRHQRVLILGPNAADDRRFGHMNDQTGAVSMRPLRSVLIRQSGRGARSSPRETSSLLFVSIITRAIHPVRWTRIVRVTGQEHARQRRRVPVAAPTPCAETAWRCFRSQHERRWEHGGSWSRRDARLDCCSVGNLVRAAA